MNILIAPDAFKDSLSAKEVAIAMEKGVVQFSEAAQCFQLFASDGGEGFLNAVSGYIKGLRYINTATFDPLGRKITSPYLWDKKDKTAYIELAKTSGIELLTETERNALKTSTYGAGVQIRDAISKGARKVYIGIGGSATNDGGIGLANALGYLFLDETNDPITPNGTGLHKIATIVKPDVDYTNVSFYAINDVLNPLFGPKGAAPTYAKQKGASPEEITFLDLGLQHLNTLVKTKLHKDIANTPGAGAAGGTAYGLKCFFDATFISGTSFILSLSNFQKLMLKEKIELIITGEGKIDFQTAYGKFVYGMIKEANKYNVPVMAVCGKLDLDAGAYQKMGLKAAVQIYDSTKPVSYSFENAKNLIEEKTFQLLMGHF